MRGYLGGVVIFAIFMSLYTGVSARLQKQKQIASAGMGKSAKNFADACDWTMWRRGAVFAQGDPERRYGCVCIAVKLQNVGQITPSKLPEAKRIYRDFVRDNRRSMRDSSPPLTYTRMRKPDTGSEELMDAVLKAYIYCDRYDLRGMRYHVYRRDLPRFDW